MEEDGVVDVEGRGRDEQVAVCGCGCCGGDGALDDGELGDGEGPAGGGEEEVREAADGHHGVVFGGWVMFGGCAEENVDDGAGAVLEGCGGRIEHDEA